MQEIIYEIPPVCLPIISSNLNDFNYLESGIHSVRAYFISLPFCQTWFELLDWFVYPCIEYYSKLNTSMYTFYNNDQEFDKLRILDFPILYQGSDTEPASEALLGGITTFEGPKNRFPLKFCFMCVTLFTACISK